MNLAQKIEEIMTASVLWLKPENRLEKAKELFEDNGFHHVPVIKNEQLVGILSKTDLLYFLRPIHKDHQEQYLNNLRLKNYTVEEAMTKNVVTVEASDTLEDALEIFSENMFHALPVKSDQKVVGIITVYDIINALLKKSSKRNGRMNSLKNNPS